MNPIEKPASPEAIAPYAFFPPKPFPGFLARWVLITAPLLVLLMMGKTGIAQVTAVYSDYGGYWTSSSTSINPVKPDNSHNLLGFTWNGTTYSTGVNDAVLTSHGISFTAQSFRAFPVSTVPNTESGFYFVMLGQLYDGLNNAVDNSSTSPFPANPTGAQLAGFLTDGVKGLNLGTGLANIPAGSVLRFDLSTNGLSLSAINDGKPDIFVTEEASPSSSSPDILEFVDAGGNIVGNALSIVTSSFPQVGNWQADFYDLTSQQSSSTYINQARPMAFYAADLSAFGITAANYKNAVALLYEPNGTSDPAFLAFSEPSISVATQLTLTAQPASYINSVVVSPSPAVQVRDGLGQNISQAGIPVTVSVQSGSATLSGTTTVNTDASGLATFSNLQIFGTGTITLAFSSTSLNTAVTGNITTVVLPLNWLSFTAQTQDQNVLLRWSTTGELDTRDFVVEHSIDGITWQPIGTVPASGGDTSVNTYQYLHSNPGIGRHDYRILQRDRDGNGEYSTVAVVSVSEAPAMVRLYPNPVVDGLLNIQLQRAATASLFDNSGKLVLQKQLSAGLQQLDLHGLPKGVYCLRIDANATAIALF
ncbi:MAG: T9SS type A sorting domain-containing protein [Puia sp.]|nr:T9SS type A sorting domain-containing protein [Puia sp.]